MVDDLRDLRNDFRRSLQARRRKPGTVTSYMECVDGYTDWAASEGRSLDAVKVRRRDVEAYLVDLSGRPQKRYTWKPVSAATVAKHYRGLQQFFKFLVEDEVIETSPMAKMSPPTVDVKAVPVLADDEIRRLVTATKGTSFRDRRDHALILFMLDTGCRVSELVGIDHATIDFESDSVVVKGKGGRERIAVFGPKTGEAIRRYLRVRRQHPRAHLTALWLGERSSALTDHGVRDILHTRGDQANVKGLHPHRLRHTFAHRFLSAGGQQVDLMVLAGWRSQQMVQRYGASAAAQRAAQAHRRLRLGEDF